MSIYNVSTSPKIEQQNVSIPNNPSTLLYPMPFFYLPVPLTLSQGFSNPFSQLSAVNNGPFQSSQINQLLFSEYPMAHMNHISGPAMVSIPSYLPSSQQRPYQYDNGLHVPSSMPMPRPVPHSMQQSMYQQDCPPSPSEDIKKPSHQPLNKRPRSSAESLLPMPRKSSSLDPLISVINQTEHCFLSTSKSCIFKSVNLDAVDKLPFNQEGHLPILTDSSTDENPSKAEIVRTKKKLKKESIGISTVATSGPILPFEEAAAFSRSLKLKNPEEWRIYCKNNDLPPGIPISPINAYRQDGWIGWSSWLGAPCEKKRRRLKVFLDFERAKEVVKSFRLKSQRAWWDFCVNGLRPPQVPGDPSRVYATSGWQGWRDWLGLDGSEQFEEISSGMEQIM